MKDEWFGKVMVTAVPKKGEDHKSIGTGSREAKKLRDGTMTWKSDQEFTTVALKHKMRIELGEGCDRRMEESPVKAHQGNGGADQAAG